MNCYSGIMTHDYEFIKEDTQLAIKYSKLMEKIHRRINMEETLTFIARSYDLLFRHSQYTSTHKYN